MRDERNGMLIGTDEGSDIACVMWKILGWAWPQSEIRVGCAGICSRLIMYNDSCTVALAVRRTDLEKRLKMLGWAPTSKASGKNHRVWAHPKQEFELYIPQYDLIPDAVGQRILEDAGE